MPGGDAVHGRVLTAVSSPASAPSPLPAALPASPPPLVATRGAGVAAAVLGVEGPAIRDAGKDEDRDGHGEGDGDEPEPCSGERGPEAPSPSPVVEALSPFSRPPTA